MSDEALQRTIRRTGAVAVLAVGGFALAFFDYLAYQGVPVDIWDPVTLWLTGGAAAYLAVSLLVGGLATARGEVERERDGGEPEPVDSPE